MALSRLSVFSFEEFEQQHSIGSLPYLPNRSNSCRKTFLPEGLATYYGTPIQKDMQSRFQRQYTQRAFNASQELRPAAVNCQQSPLLFSPHQISQLYKMGVVSPASNGTIPGFHFPSPPAQSSPRIDQNSGRNYNYDTRKKFSQDIDPASIEVDELMTPEVAKIHLAILSNGLTDSIHEGLKRAACIKPTLDERNYISEEEKSMEPDLQAEFASLFGANGNKENTENKPKMASKVRSKLASTLGTVCHKQPTNEENFKQITSAIHNLGAKVKETFEKSQRREEPFKRDESQPALSRELSQRRLRFNAADKSRISKGAGNKHMHSIGTDIQITIPDVDDSVIQAEKKQSKSITPTKHRVLNRQRKIKMELKAPIKVKRRYANGKTYEGELLEGKRHGFGVLYYENGKKEYEGYWKADQFSGQGTLYNRSVAQVADDFSFDYNDFGALKDYWIRFEGHFSQGKFEGLGTYYLVNKQKLIGYFHGGKLDGLGDFYLPKGQVVRGTWSKNKLVEKEGIPVKK